MTVICDIDGVVYRGDQLVPGSDRALQRLVTAGVDLYFATNNSTKTPANVAERISTMTGVDILPARLSPPPKQPWGCSRMGSAR